MILYIIRHAWAGHYGDPEWPDDFERLLTEKGRERFAQVVEHLVDRGFAPEIVATSPLVRCRQTAEVVVDGLPEQIGLVELDALVPGSNLDALLTWTTAQAEKYTEVAWVGHAPDVGHLAGALIGGPGSYIRFAKGGVAAITFDDTPAAGEGELRWLVTAKLLGC